MIRSEPRFPSPRASVVRALRFTAALAGAASLAAPARAQPATATATPATTGRPAEGVILRGTLVGGDGRPMVAAHVQLLSPDMRPLANAAADSLGRFVVATAASGPLRLRCTGVQHEPRMTDLVAAPGADLAVDVRLKALAPAAAFDSVRARVARPNAPDTTVRLTRGADGVFRGAVPTAGDTASVRVLGIVKDVDVVPDGARSYAPFGYNGYRAVLRAVDGFPTVVAYDPRRLVRDTAPGALRFRDTTTVAARYAAIDEDVLARSARAYEAYKAQGAAGKAPTRMDFGDELAVRQRQLAAERDPLLRQRLLARIVFVTTGDTSAGATAARRAASAAVDPRSPVWLLNGGVAWWMLASRATANDPAPRDTSPAARARRTAALAAYVDTVLADPAVPRATRAELLAALARSYAESKQPARADSLYTALGRDYGGSYFYTFDRARYAAGRAVAAGRPVPAFRFAALGAPSGASLGTSPGGVAGGAGAADGARAVTPASLRGKTVLMDFWAVWCAPCVAEIPNIQKAYAKYRARGFDVLSVSLDGSEADVAKFRREKQPMPWRHARAPEAFEDPGVKAFQVVGIPRAVLVGPDGTILGADDELRGARLDATLARLLAAPPRPAGAAR